MPTVTKTIGSAGRDYSTIASWAAALPANFVTDGNAQRGECYNDSEFTGVGGTSLGSHTTDVTHDLTLTAAAGQSFQDNANIRTNALRYNVSNGVGIKSTTGYSSALASINVKYLTVSRLQFLSAGNSGNTGCRFYNTDTSTDIGLVKDCIFEKSGTGIGYCLCVQGLMVVNVLVIYNSNIAPAATVGALQLEYGTAVGCTIVRPSNKTIGGYGIGRGYGTSIIESCAVFGFSTSNNTGFSASSKNNATNLSSIVGSAAQTSITYSSATPFQNGTSAASAHDFRAIVSTSLAANGFNDSSNAPNDISGTARAASPTIGVWELISTVTPFDFLFFPHLNCFYRSPISITDY